MLRRCVPVVLAIGLTGCGTMPFELVERESAPVPTSLGNSIPPSTSMAALPLSAGNVIAVIERQRGNALQHEVTLNGAPPNYGENQILVTAFRYTPAIPEKPVSDALPMRRPTAEDIIQEMEERVRGGAMPISGNAPQNSAGPFAYAFAKRAGVSCLYAWQWIESEHKATIAPVSVRVRLCKPNTTEEVLVDHVRQLYLQPRTRPGQTGAPLVARGGGAYRDALSAAGRAGTQTHPYGVSYGAGPVMADAPVIRATPTERKVAAASVQKRVLVRRIVKRRVTAPQIYSYAPPVQSAPAATTAAAPVMRSMPAPARGYSAVPMPQ